jgi:hypothetical protein
MGDIIKGGQHTPARQKSTVYKNKKHYSSSFRAFVPASIVLYLENLRNKTTVTNLFSEKKVSEKLASVLCIRISIIFES